MDNQDRIKYRAILALLKSGSSLHNSLWLHDVSKTQWAAWKNETSAPLPEVEVEVEVDSQQYQLAVDTINTSAQTVRNLFITFVLAIASVSIMIASATDKVLFLNQQITLPLINIGLTASSFFTVAPVLLLVLHANLAFNLYVLIHKVKAFDYVDSDLFYPFILIQSRQESRLNNTVKDIGRTILAFVTLAPILINFWILNRFTIYQDDGLSYLHILICLLNVALLVFISTLLDHNEFKKKNTGTFGINSIKVHMLSISTIAIAIVLVFITPFSSNCELSKINRNQSLCFNESASRFFKAHFDFANGSEFSTSSPQPNWQFNLQQAQSTNLNSEKPYYRPIQGMEDYIARFTKGVELNERNLRFLKCEKCFLQKADFRGADLSGAKLKGTDLSYSDMSDSTLIGASLSQANLSNVKLNKAKLVGGRFHQTKFHNMEMQETLFKQVNLEKAQFFAVEPRSISSLKIHHSYSIGSDASKYNDHRHSTGFYGGMDSVEFCDFDGAFSAFQGAYKDKGLPQFEGNLLPDYKGVNIHFSNLANTFVGELRLTFSSWQFVNLSKARLVDLNFDTDKTNYFVEIDVTETQFENTDFLASKSFEKAMCLTLDDKGIAKPPFTEDYGVPYGLNGIKTWPICRKIPKQPIPCEQPKKLQALKDKILTQKQQFCHVNQDGNCVFNQPESNNS